MADEAYPDAMPVGYRLHWYVLEHVLGQGGFGITYLARDTNLDRRVAIKEYLPTDYAQRRSDAQVRPRTQAQAERYAWGLERFLAEARTLARFEHPNIVRVNSVFEANNTAYMVMRFEEGENLATLLERHGTLPERRLVDCLLLVLDGLQLVHDAGFIHRDIKPENIYVREDGSPVLLDFGSARQSLGRAKTMTILVAPGYAPLEQYYGEAATQGPWTDIYGLGATCYRAITGRAPLDAVARAKGVLGSAREMLQPAVEVGRGRYSERFLAAVDHALQLSERDRPQSIAEWRRELVATPPPVLPAPKPALPDVPPARPTARRSPLVWGTVFASAALAVIVAALMPPGRPPDARPTTPPPPSITPSIAPPSTVAPAPGQVQDPPQNNVAAVDIQATTQKVAAITPAPVPPVAAPAPRAPTPLHLPAAKPSITPAPPASVPGTEPVVAAPPAPPPTVAPPAIEVALSTKPNKPSDNAGRRNAWDDQLEAAEAALGKGDHAAAVRILTPLAEGGMARAQLMLGRTFEESSGRQHSDFEAYLWYGKAALAGESGATTRKARVAARLQPSERRQADGLIEQRQPQPEPGASAAH